MTTRQNTHPNSQIPVQNGGSLANTMVISENCVDSSGPLVLWTHKHDYIGKINGPGKKCPLRRNVHIGGLSTRGNSTVLAL